MECKEKQLRSIGDDQVLSLIVVRLICLTLPEQFTFSSDKYSDHHIKAMEKYGRVLSFRNILERQNDYQTFMLFGTAPSDNQLRQAKFNELVIKTQNSSSAKWAILAYLSNDDFINAGKLIAAYPQTTLKWLSKDHKEFFRLHQISPEQRLEILIQDVFNIENMRSEHGMRRFLIEWNLSPYLLIDSRYPNIRRTAMKLL